MTDHAVRWHEGMFLTPQHFQAADRWNARQRSLGSQWDEQYPWGIRSIEIDQDALANHRLVVRRLQARMPGGSLLCFPEDGTLAVIDLRATLARHDTAVIYLALPLDNPSRPSTTEVGADHGARHNVDAVEVPDENTGADKQAIQVLKPNARLLVEGDDLAGYEVLPIVRIARSEATAGGSPIIDPRFIPPVLACDAWPPLRVGVLTQLLERLERKAEVLAGQAVARGLGFDSHGQGEQLLLAQLRSLHEAVALMTVDLTSQGITPLGAYRELARLVGRLSIFSGDKRVRSLPAYDHDRLGPCFATVVATINELLSMVVVPSYEERRFQAENQLLKVQLESSWLEAEQRVLLGVESSLPADEVETMIARGSNMKFGSAERAETLFLQGDAGLEPRRLLHVPRALPARRGLSYYELSTPGIAGEWHRVERSLSLAVRIAEHLLVDEVPGQNLVVLDLNGKTATLGMSLFVVRDGAPVPSTVEGAPVQELASV